ncbi:MAG: type II secretion system F family protein [Planctomycetota bacterium]|nr:type II secretion system F family protein [Planctomycetota bacterium]MDA0932375.1 type II secretion system F family protein [Planctomycetota bacterium]MDA1221080.1 type II secretion system F family protein [Planctomycetota bacterium]
MATTYKFEAKDASGRTVSGTLTASTQADVVADLRRKSLVPVSILESRKSGGFLSLSRGEKTQKQAKKASVKKGELEVFTRQLSTMLSAGIPLLEALEILADQAETPGFRFCLNKVVDDIRNGADLSRALEPHKNVFSDIYVSMVRAGEVSGQIDVILTRLAEYLEAAAHLRQEIKSAMTYPVVSLFLVLGIAGFLMIGIVPSFRPVFDSLGVELPALTVVIMGVAEFMRDQWYVMFGAIIALVFAVKFAVKTEKGAFAWDKLKLRVPVFGPLFRKVALSRFARTFATLVKSGVPILGAMEIVSQTAGNRVISGIVDAARDSVKQGDSLSDPFAKSAEFPSMVTKMMAIGERSGALDALLEKIAEFYDQQVESEVKGLTSLIEPIMIGVMGFVVGGIVLAVFLPIFKLQETLSSGG